MSSANGKRVKQAATADDAVDVEVTTTTRRTSTTVTHTGKGTSIPHKSSDDAEVADAESSGSAVSGSEDERFTLDGIPTRRPRVATRTMGLPRSLYARVFNKLKAYQGQLYPFHIGETFLLPSQQVMETLASADVPDVHHYAHPQGLVQLREHVVQYLANNGYGRPAVDRVIVTHGATHGLNLACQAIFDPGDVCLVLSPHWPLINGMIHTASAVPIEVPFFNTLRRKHTHGGASATTTTSDASGSGADPTSEHIAVGKDKAAHVSVSDISVSDSRGGQPPLVSTHAHTHSDSDLPEAGKAAQGELKPGASTNGSGSAGQSDGMHIRTSNGHDIIPSAYDLLSMYVTPRLRAVYVTSPNNPDGTVLTEEEMADIARFCVEHNLYCLSDEAYEAFHFTRRPKPMCTLPGMQSLCISLFTFSKSFRMAGLRVGFALGPRDVVAAMIKLANNSIYNVSLLTQRAALTALRDCVDTVQDTVSTAKTNREIICQELRAAKGIKFTQPEGGAYVFVDATQVLSPRNMDAFDLLEKCLPLGIVFAPGVGFGRAYHQWFRLCYTTMKEDMLRTGVRKLVGVLNGLQ